jgi:hypothetical protein
MNDCMICLEKCDEPRIDCKCKGTNGYIHAKCLQNWYKVKATTMFCCPHCKTQIHVFVLNLAEDPIRFITIGENHKNNILLFIIISLIGVVCLILIKLYNTPRNLHSMPTVAPTKFILKI